MKHVTHLHRCIEESRAAGGFFIASNSPEIAELIANGTELDFVCVDLQHAAVSSADGVHILRAIQAADSQATPLVRVPDHSVYWIQQMLDAGYTGLIVPLVESAEEARQLVQAAFFPPVGVRSLAGSVRASIYDVEVAGINDRIILLPQIESAQGLEHIEEIVAVEGVTGVFIGPDDLRLSCGWSGKDLWSYKPFTDAIQQILDACHKHDKIAAIPCGKPNDARDAGFQMIALGGDIGEVRNGMVSRINDMLKQLQSPDGSGHEQANEATDDRDRQRPETYRKSLAHYDRWIESNLQKNDDAWRHPGSADAYFSLSVYANYIGRLDWALSALRHVEKHFIDADGTLKQNANRDQMINYAPSWFAWAAFEVEAYELCTGLLDHISSFQHHSSGGFFAGIKERDSNRGPIDFDSTTMSTIALARGGRVESSTSGAEYLLNLCQAQPAPNEKFCTAWSEPGGILIDPAQTAPTTILTWTKPRQHYYKMGLLVVALAQVYGVTGRREFLDTAIKMYKETISRASDLWTNTLGHKMCWAATTLYAITREKEYLQEACRFADHLVCLQQRDGSYAYPELWETFPPEPWEKVPNIGCQFALWISRVLRLLEFETYRGFGG